MDRLERENAALRAEVHALKGRPSRPARAPAAARGIAPTAPAALASAEAAKPSPFDGAYVGAFGGVTFAGDQMGRPLPGTSTVNPIYPYGYTPNRVRASDANASFGLLAGYGETVGSLYLGGEVRADLRDQRRAYIDRMSYLPYHAAVSWQKASIEGGADASLRVGLTFDEWLVFGRIGAGAAFIRGSTGASQWAYWLGPAILPAARRTSDAVTPYVTIGVGVERAFGPAFIRLDTEIINYLGSAGTFSSDKKSSVLSFGQFYDGRVTAAIGYRW
ncbi:hypothetical protein [Enterovirga rhinocerotis]|nr:hypothetical protein [Enterovirga rhinocerotis]